MRQKIDFFFQKKIVRLPKMGCILLVIGIFHLFSCSYISKKMHESFFTFLISV